MISLFLCFGLLSIGMAQAVMTNAYKKEQEYCS